jgi:hypothetical protein
MDWRTSLIKRIRILLEISSWTFQKRKDDGIPIVKSREVKELKTTSPVRVVIPRKKTIIKRDEERIEENTTPAICKNIKKNIPKKESGFTNINSEKFCPI